MDELIIAGMKEVNPEKRKEYYKKAQEIIMKDAPWLFLHVQKDVIAYRANVKNVIELPLEILIVKWADKE